MDKMLITTTILNFSSKNILNLYFNLLENTREMMPLPEISHRMHLSNYTRDAKISMSWKKQNLSSTRRLVIFA